MSSPTVIREYTTSCSSPLELKKLEKITNLPPSLFKEEAERSLVDNVPVSEYYLRKYSSVQTIFPLFVPASAEGPKLSQGLMLEASNGIDERNVAYNRVERASLPHYTVLAQGLELFHAVLDVGNDPKEPGKTVAPQRAFPAYKAVRTLRNIFEGLENTRILAAKAALLFFHFAGYTEEGKEMWSESEWDAGMFLVFKNPGVAETHLYELPAEVVDVVSKAFYKETLTSVQSFLLGQSKNKFLCPMSLKVLCGSQPLFLIMGYVPPKFGGYLLQEDGYFDCNATIKAWSQSKPVFSFECEAMKEAPYEREYNSPKGSVTSVIGVAGKVRHAVEAMSLSGHGIDWCQYSSSTTAKAEEPAGAKSDGEGSPS